MPTAAIRRISTGVRVIDSPVGRFAYAYGSTLPAGADAALATLAKTTLVRVTLPAQYDAGQKAHPFANRGTTDERGDARVSL